MVSPDMRLARQLPNGEALYILKGALPLTMANFKRPKPITRTKVLQGDPLPDTLELTIKQFTNADRVSRQNQFSKTRYLSADPELGATVREVDVPGGDIAVNDIILGLKAWNLTDENDEPVTISRTNVLAWLEPAEFDYLITQIRAFNPLVFGGEPVETDAGE